MYTIAKECGTESGRSMLVDADEGREIATTIDLYAPCVIDERLPDSTMRPPLDWALQDPADYLAVVRTTIPELLRQTGVNPAEFKSVGVDFTYCAMLPTLNDGTSLHQLPESGSAQAAHAIYDLPYTDYATPYDTFGRRANDVIERLKRLRAAIQQDSVAEERER